MCSFGGISGAVKKLFTTGTTILEEGFALSATLCQLNEPSLSGYTILVS